MELIKVENKANLYRDKNTNAIINMNTNAYENYLEQRKKRLEKENEINSLKSDINSLKSDISEIKTLLMSLSNNN